jgi:hypothetical protein
MKTSLKRILVALLCVFVIAQFIRPEENYSDGEAPHRISTTLPLPSEVQAILEASCFDCHSNVTRYPWYFRIQPFAWLMDEHIREGKQHLNFDEFGTYRLRRQYHKLEEIVEQIEEETMPLPSYTIIHPDLTRDQRNRLIVWANSVRDTMAARYSMDSLVGSLSR